MDSLNDMIDQQTVRLSGLNNRVPDAVLWLELLGAALALGLLALYLSVLGRGLVPIVAAAVIVSFLVLVTFDLDRPTRGLIKRLRSYNDLAIRVTYEIPGSAAIRATTAQQGRLQRALWRLAGESLNAHPRDTAPRLYVDSLNDMIDQQTVRLSGLNNRVPDAVLWLELLGAALALGLLALYLTVLGKGLIPIAVAAVIVSFLVLVTFDLDRPTRGLIQIPATPLLAEKATMSLPPAAPAPG